MTGAGLPEIDRGLARPLLTNRSSMQPAPQTPRLPTPPWGVSLTLDVLQGEAVDSPHNGSMSETAIIVNDHLSFGGVGPIPSSTGAIRKLNFLLRMWARNQFRLD